MTFMKTAFAFLVTVIAMLAGCNADRPLLEHDGTVVIRKADFSDAELARIVVGIASWRNASPDINLRIWIDGDAGSNGITIRRGCPTNNPDDNATYWSSGPDVGTVCVNSPTLTAMPRVIAHEVGHALLGPDHDDSVPAVESVMHSGGPAHHASAPTCHDVHNLGLRCMGE